MPSTEQVAVTILREEGFENIHWESLINWTSPYDFRATKDGVECFIEVKACINAVFQAKGKLSRLRELNKPVFFLIVEGDVYYFVPLEDFNNIDVRKPPHKTIQMSEGRITVPNYLMKAAGIGKKGWVVVEAYPDLEGCKSLFIRRG